MISSTAVARFRSLRSSRPRSLVITTLLGTSLAISNWWMYRENTRLRKELEFADSMQHTRVGIKVPPLHGRDLEGKDITLSYEQATRGTLLFVFSPLCGYSKVTWPAWQELERGAAGKRVVFVNVKGDLSRQFLEKYPTGSATLLASTDPASILEYQFRETPVTVLIGPDGRTEKVWRGAIDNSRLPSVKKDTGWVAQSAGL